MVLLSVFNWQGQDHLLGVVIEAEAGKKQYIVLVLRPDLPSTLQVSPASGGLQDLKAAEFQQGSFLLPKSKRRAEEEFDSAISSRKRSGPIRIELPSLGAASGMSYEVRRVETREFLFMCTKKIRVEQARLLEDSSPAAYSRTVQQLLELSSDGSKYPPTLDPVSGIAFFFFFSPLPQRDLLLNSQSDGSISLAPKCNLFHSHYTHLSGIIDCTLPEF